MSDFDMEAQASKLADEWCTGSVHEHEVEGKCSAYDQVMAFGRRCWTESAISQRSQDEYMAKRELEEVRVAAEQEGWKRGMEEVARIADADAQQLGRQSKGKHDFAHESSKVLDCLAAKIRARIEERSR